MLNIRHSRDPEKLESTALQKKLDQLPAVEIQHAPAKLPSKLHMFAYVDFLAQSLCSVHSDCASKLGCIKIGERFE